MNSKQRVHAALRREPVDRVPIFMWFHPETRTLLAKLFEVPPASVDFVLGNDVRMTCYPTPPRTRSAAPPGD